MIIEFSETPVDHCWLSKMKENLVGTQKFRLNNKMVWSISWSPSGILLACSGANKTIQIWTQINFILGKDRHKLNNEWLCCNILLSIHSKTIRQVMFSPDECLLSLASFDSYLSIWKLSSGVVLNIAKLEGHQNEVKCVAWSSNSKFLATGGRDKTIWIWEFLNCFEIAVADVCQGHLHDVKCVAWHPDCAHLVSGSYDETIRVWSKSNGTRWFCSQTLQVGSIIHKSTVWSISFNRDGSQFVSCAEDKTVKIWSLFEPVNNKNSLKSPKYWTKSQILENYQTRPAFALDWSNEGEIVTASTDCSIRIFSAKNKGQLMFNINDWKLAIIICTINCGDCNTANWSTINRSVAWGANDGKVRIYDFNSCNTILNTEEIT